MLRGLLSMFLLGRVFRMFSGHHRSPAYHRSHYNRGWGHRSHSLDLGSLMGFHRRRRSFI
jgi:hypothetical protein